MIENKLLRNVINNLDIGYWELQNNTSRWSSAFFSKLGYNTNELEISLDYFLNHLIHSDDRDNFRDNFFSLVRNYLDFMQLVSIKCKDGTYKEFVCVTNDTIPINDPGNAKVIFFNEKKYKSNPKVKKDNYYYRESAEMTSTGSWYIDFNEQKTYWDDQTRKILEYPEDYIPSSKNSSKYYADAYQQLAADCFLKCAKVGTPFDTEIKMLTFKARELWARLVGKPVYNDNNEIVGVRGVFQDIDDEKSKIVSLQKTSEIIASQNSRLYNFAHIVSHNLRSHTSNLSLVIELMDDVNTIDEKLELLSSIKDISESLNSTIEHLNEVVTIQTQTNENRINVSFEETLSIVKKSIGGIIRDSNTILNSDFSTLNSVPYIPAYLQSIILNLVTNAIKYKHPERDPVITIKSYVKDNNSFLEIIDNGLGIDMNKFGSKIFGMYNTFHYNKDAVGIGLFITKNQVESLNGQITVVSKVNVGTTFKIQF